MKKLAQIVQTTRRHLMFFEASTNEAPTVARIHDFLVRSPDPFSRKEVPGHITASAWIVNDSFTSAFLINHRSLGKWMQPGGHIEPDEYPVEAAIREAREETGLDGVEILPPGLFDVDIHIIPENPKKNEPEHMHFDLRYVVRADHGAGVIDSAECVDGDWFDLRQLAVDETKISSLRRMAAKTLRTAPFS